MTGRRNNDFYATPSWATEILLDHVGVSGTVLEACSGAGHIANTLRRSSRCVVEMQTNDIDTRMDTDWHLDVLGSEILNFRPDWIVTNPPFNIADLAVPRFLNMTRRGVAVLLRLSWLEPTRARAAFLAAHPPSHLIVLPRISFTGDGKSDSVTTAWFVWDAYQSGQAIEIVPKRYEQPVLLEETR